jgi:carboxyl-terminal processing protease
MQITPTFVRLIFYVAVAYSVGLTSGKAFAQVRNPQAPATNVAELQEILQTGEQLERERRWGEALNHYEDAARTFPSRADLKQRMTTARFHLEVSRRYADQSFLRSLNDLSQQQALDLYSEVLLKIQSYYVNEPDWTMLVRRGIHNIEIATTEPAFVERYPRPVSADQSSLFSQELRRVVGAMQVRDRHEARQAASLAAQVSGHYLGIPPQAAILEFTCAAAASLDPYSSFLTADQLDEVFSQIEGNFVGLGIELKPDRDSLFIVSVVPGGPAEIAGIQPNDRITAVDGHQTSEISTDKAADMLKGPELSYVEVMILSPNGSSRQMRIQRRRVEVPSVEDAKIVDAENGVAYMRLTSFQKTTSKDVDDALWALHRQGMRSLIIDVRNNPGGLLNASVEVADKFLTAGIIVSTRGRSEREDFDYRAHSVGTWRVPLVVMINGESASASEIFAGAIYDHRRGTVIGERSYGKGSVQGIFPLSRFKSGVRLTTAKFYSPSGRAISHAGVQPHVAVQRETQPNVQNGELAHQVAKPTVQGEIIPQDDAALRVAVETARRSSQYQARAQRGS